MHTDCTAYYATFIFILAGKTLEFYSHLYDHMPDAWKVLSIRCQTYLDCSACVSIKLLTDHHLFSFPQQQQQQLVLADGC